MKNRTEGAWIITHTTKLQDVSNANEFEDVEIAGKCGMFLSNLSADEDLYLGKEKIDTIAKISGIKKLELSSIINKLIEEKLIYKDGDYIQVLVVT